MVTFGVVDVEARFQMISGKKRLVKTFVLQKCIVADVGFSNDIEDSFLKWKDLRIPMKVVDRAWWCVARLKESGNTKRNKGSGPAPMQLDVLIQ